MVEYSALASKASFVKDKISSDKITIKQYIDTDSMLENKLGVETALSLPPKKCKLTKFKKGDILIANIRPYLKKIWYSNMDGGCSSDVLVVRAKGGMDPKFLYYSLFRDDFFNHMMRGSTGTKMPRGDKAHILEFLIPQFDKIITKKITEELSALDEKIELNRKINIELEAMAKLIYDYWFVQYDFPDEDGKPYKSSGGKMIYNEELNREIPDNWEVGTLLDIATFTNGIACQKYRPNRNEPYYKVIKIREMGAVFTKITELVSKNIPKKVVINNGDILFSWSATLDVKIWTSGTGALNQHIFKVISNKYPRTYYYFEVLQYLYHFKMIANLRKTTMGHITQDHLRQSRISIPPVDLIENLHTKIGPILNKVVKGMEENTKLIELRDCLLLMLMNGQVTVEDST